VVLTAPDVRAVNDRELQRVRSIPLESVLEGLGARRDPKDPRRNWRINESRITVKDAKFFDHNREKGGGGAIDLVQHITGYDFKQAIGWLGANHRVISAASKRQAEQTKKQGSAPAITQPPTPDPNRLTRVRWYLTEKRAIPERIVDREIAKGHVYADTKANVVFKLRDDIGKEIGYELRGTYDKAFHSVSGEKGLFFTGTKQGRVAAFVESAIEALSYRALRGNLLVISTTGNAIELPGRMGKHLLQRGFRLISAFNADRDGDRMAERFNERMGREVVRDRPDERVGKDWNVQLCAQREIKALQCQIRARR
jgi:hypothetical protein